MPTLCIIASDLSRSNLANVYPAIASLKGSLPAGGGGSAEPDAKAGNPAAIIPVPAVLTKLRLVNFMIVFYIKINVVNSVPIKSYLLFQGGHSKLKILLPDRNV
jgi:hypothetical protein